LKHFVADLSHSKRIVGQVRQRTEFKSRTGSEGGDAWRRGDLPKGGETENASRTGCGQNCIASLADWRLLSVLLSALALVFCGVDIAHAQSCSANAPGQVAAS